MDIEHEAKSLKRMRDQVARALMLSGKGTTEMIDAVTQRLYELRGVVNVAGLGEEFWNVVESVRERFNQVNQADQRVASCVTRTLLELIEAYAKADARSPLNPDAAALRAEIVTRLDRIRDYADEPSGRVVRQQLSGTS